MQFLAAAISGDRFVIGAPSNDDAEQGDQNRNNSGAVHVYERDGSGDWAETAFLKPAINDAGDQFGRAVALAGDDLVVGAFEEDSASVDEPGDNSFSRAGAAYVLRRGTTGQWTFTEFLKAIAPDQFDDFGIAVAIGRSSIAVGARNDSGVDGDPESDAVPASGAVYAFPR